MSTSTPDAGSARITDPAGRYIVAAPGVATSRFRPWPKGWPVDMAGTTMRSTRVHAMGVREK